MIKYSNKIIKPHTLFNPIDLSIPNSHEFSLILLMNDTRSKKNDNTIDTTATII